MMEKLLHFDGRNQRTGAVFTQVVRPGRGMSKMASVGDLHPDVQYFIKHLEAQPGHTYVLNNALGSWEAYGCFPAGTLVQTETGERPIEEVLEGDQVRTHLNRLQRVRATQVREHVGSLVDLKVAGLPSTHPALTATPNHEVWAVPRDEFLRLRRKLYYKAGEGTRSERRRNFLLATTQAFEWIPIAHLSKGDFIAQPFPLGETAGAWWHDPDLAFLAGLYAAEGCVTCRKDRADTWSATFVISQEEQDVVFRARKAAEKFGYSLGVWPEPETNSVRMQLSWTDFAKFCNENIGSGAENKRLSNEILTAPRGWQETFFSAYANGDGCVRGPGRGEESIRCVSASAGLLMDMRLLLARLGKVASISGRHNEKATWYNGNPIFELLVGSSQGTEQSRAKSYLHPGGYILSAVAGVEEYRWAGDVYNLHVGDDNSYVASGIVVHNSNINGDTFPEAGLLNGHSALTAMAVDDVEGRTEFARSLSFGYPTFYTANIFQHHMNKNPEKTLGKIILVVWNPRMRRVECLFDLDHERCRAQDAWGLIERINADEFPPSSMGCKVPDDRCSICGNHAKTRDQYCNHVNNKDPRFGMNKILGDGRVCCVHNDKPRFFDDSFVTIGADKTAFLMAKLAHAGQKYWIFTDGGLALPSAQRGEIFYGGQEIEKTAGRLPGMKTLKGLIPSPVKIVRDGVITIPATVVVTDKVRGGKQTTVVVNDPSTKTPTATGLPKPSIVKVASLTDALLDGVSMSIADDGIAEMSKTRSGKATLALAGTAGAALAANRIHRHRATQEVETRKVKEAARKIGEMLKSLPPGPSRIMDRLQNAEPRLPPHVLNRLAASPTLEGALHSPTRVGIVLQPPEFQRVMLMRNGLPDLADEYDRHGVTFAPPPPCGGGVAPQVLPPDAMILELVQMLLSFVQRRSCAGPVMRRRLTMMFAGPSPGAPATQIGDDPVLRKLAGAYASYRGSILSSLDAVGASFQSPLIKQAFLREDVLDLKAGIKEGSASDTTAALALLATVGPLAYLNSAYLKDRELAGEDLGLIQEIMANHPGLVTALSVTPAAVALRNPAAVAAATKALA